MEKRKSKDHPSLIDIELAQAIESKQHCLFVRSESEAWADDHFRYHVKQLCQALHYPVCEIQGNVVSGDNLLFSLLDTFPKSVPQIDADLSNYRKLCSIFDNTEPSVIVVYDAHKLNQDGAQIISLVARYLKRNLSNWKILLLSNDPSFSKANYFHLPLDTPSHGDGAGYVNQPRARLRVVSSVLIGAMAIATLAYILNSQPQQERESTYTTATPTLTKQQQSKLVADSATDSSLHRPDSDQTLSQPRDESWLSDEEFNQIIARLNSSPTDQPKNVTPASSAVKPQYKAPLSEAMISAVNGGDIKGIKALLAQGENLSGVSPKEQTPLILASISGNTSLVTWLIEQGVSVNEQDVFARTALYYTAVHGNLDTAEVLLSHGASPNRASDLNKTPLMAAVHNDYVELADLLLRHEAQIDIRDHSGWSAIFYAVWNDNLEMVERLMKEQPNLSGVDNSGNSLSVIAKARNHDRILLALNLDSKKPQI